MGSGCSHCLNGGALIHSELDLAALWPPPSFRVLGCGLGHARAICHLGPSLAIGAAMESSAA